MCGRYTLTRTNLREVAELLGATVSADDAAAHRPRYNIAPSSPGWLVVADAGARQIVRGRWGFPVPFGPRQDDPVGLINARAESIADKPTFRGALAHGRCGVVADGFFEWTGHKGHKRPLWFHPPGGDLLVFAGLWREVADPDTGEVERRFAILTTDANRLVAPIHERMPAILAPGALARWLAPAPSERAAFGAFAAGLQDILAPAPEGALEATAVSPRVNDARVDDPLCIAAEPTLF